MYGVINKIIPFSAVDGPGNRTVIFFQGCNMNCSYCHNPETIQFCNNCSDCVDFCNSKALSISGNNVYHNQDLCTHCDTCIQVCKYSSSPKTRYFSVDDILNQLSKTRIFISGVTISGGECTVQTDFLFHLLRKLKEENYHVLLDTNGLIETDKLNLLLPLFDKAMLDIKTFDNNKHLHLTGKSNKTVLQNFKLLAQNNKLLEVRTVLYPGIENLEQEVMDICKYIAHYGNNITYKLIKYRKYSSNLSTEEIHTLDECRVYDLINEVSKYIKVVYIR